MIGLTWSVALEYAAENLRVNAVCPTIVETPAIESMSSEEREEVTGHTLLVDGGQTQQ